MDFSSQKIWYDRSLIVGYDPFPPDRGVADPETAWVFIVGGIRNARITTGFSSRVSRILHGTGRRTEISGVYSQEMMRSVLVDIDINL